MKTSVKWFMLAIFAMGVIRFALSLVDVPDSTVKYASMTVLLIAIAPLVMVYWIVNSMMRSGLLPAF